MGRQPWALSLPDKELCLREALLGPRDALKKDSRGAAGNPRASPSSQAQTERSNVSSHQGEHAQPSTGALVLSTASSPSHTPTLNTLTTLVPRDTDAKSVGGALSSSSSEPPLPLPSVSQSYQFSSTLPSAGASTHPLQSSPDAPTPLSSSPPPLSVSPTASAPASLSDSQTALPHAPFTPVLPRTRDAPVTSVRMSAVASSIPSSQTADPPKNQSSPYLENTVTESKPPSLQTLPAEATKAVTVMSTLGPTQAGRFFTTKPPGKPNFTS